MVSKEYRKKAHDLVKRSKEKGLITKYKDWCKTKEAQEYSMKEEEVAYYISKKKEETK